MTLEEAIKHCKEVADQLEGKNGYAYTDSTCDECAKEHRQLAEWLKKLQAYEEAKEEITRNRNNGQWSNTVVFGMDRALLIMRKHIREVNADE